MTESMSERNPIYIPYFLSFELLGDYRQVAVVLAHCHPDELLLHVVERNHIALADRFLEHLCGGLGTAAGAPAVLLLGEEVPHLQHTLLGEDHGLLDHMLQLPDIALPGPLHQFLAGLVPDAPDVLAVFDRVLAHEELRLTGRCPPSARAGAGG